MAVNVEGFAPLLQVFDMPRALAFYRGVLGFEVVERSGEGDEFDWGLLRLGRIELMLNTAYEREKRPAGPEAERVKGHEDVTLFFGCRDLDGLYAHLREHGVEAEPPRVAWYGMRQVWLKDPDGYGVCFQWPTGSVK